MSNNTTYNPQEIEKKWQEIWEGRGCFASEVSGDRCQVSAKKDAVKSNTSLLTSPRKQGEKSSKHVTLSAKNYQPSTVNHQSKKCYVLEQFPYPSGKLHMGHLRLYTLGDLVARYKKANGFDVLHPMGWDAFGLPAENAAIENNTHPADWTYKNIENMRQQLKSVGFSYDWSREIATCDPEYYKHEQKMFLDFYKEGIAYRKESMVNWDPVDHTVLANEQVIEGKGWRSGVPVEKKKLTQWFLKITDFANELLEELKDLREWPENVRHMQEKWIGKSYGATIDFKIADNKEKITVYTTRPDTIFGAAFLAISPHHPIAIGLAQNNKELQEFIDECNRNATSEEALEKAEKQGFDTGLKVSHPFLEGEELPLYVANFVLMEYGTGAIFGCPAHDERDFEFAKKYDLSVKQVIKSGHDSSEENSALPYTGDGIVINSDFLDGLTVVEAKEKAIQKLEELKIGERKVNFRLRDWGISRQRYWGCPIPIIHCSDCGVVPVPENQLPVELPKDVSFDKPGNPLEHHTTWKNVACPKCGKDAKRETDTFDTFMESSWYFARYCSPNAENAFAKDEADHWLPVDFYLGGIEHAVLHLLYSRFFMKALAKCGYTQIKEPFKGLFTQGMVCRETYKGKNGKWVYPEEVIKKDGKYIHKTTGEEINVGRTEKMSKSKKNVVSPEEIITKYGADTARLFMLSDSPPERNLEWSDTGIEGAYKYLNRLWRLVESAKSRNTDARSHTPETLNIIHKTIYNVTQDIENFHFNKAIARIRELTNELEKNPGREEAEIAIRLLYPMIPHIAEEMWRQLGNDAILAESPWPEADPELLKEDRVSIVVQLNGKKKGMIEIPANQNDEETKQAALALPSVQQAVEGKEIKKVIVVKNRIINVVA